MHRLESDYRNASGWYGRSSAPEKPSADELQATAAAAADFEEEWETIALTLLGKSQQQPQAKL